MSSRNQYFYKGILTGLILLALPAMALQQPQFKDPGNPNSLELGDDLKAAIKKQAPRFIPLQSANFLRVIPGYFSDAENETPQAIVGDFNGDKIQDAILLGLVKSKDPQESQPFKVQAMLYQSSKKDYRPVLIEEWGLKIHRRNSLDEAYQQLNNFNIYLRTLSNHEKRSHWIPKDREAFIIEVDRGPTRVMQFTGRSVEAVEVKRSNP
jgi:hypothetical protein